MISMNLPAIWWGLTHQGKKNTKTQSRMRSLGPI